MRRKILFAVLIMALCSISVWSQDQAIVISKTAQFREKPSKTAKVIFTVKKGAKFKLESTTHKNGWYNVSVLNGNQKGWIHGNDIKIDFTEIVNYIKNQKIDNKSGEFDAFVKSQKNVDYSKIYKDEWIFVSSSTYGKMYYNPAKMRKIDERLYFWIKDTNLSGANEITSNLSYREADCDKMATRVLKYVAYDGYGAVIKSEDYQNVPMSVVIPDSTGESILEEVCKASK